MKFQIFQIIYIILNIKYSQENCDHDENEDLQKFYKEHSKLYFSLYDKYTD